MIFEGTRGYCGIERGFGGLPGALGCATLPMHSAVKGSIIIQMPKPARKKDAAAVALGRRGGLNSRKNLTPEKRTRLARKAARARWKKAKGAKKP